MPQITFNLSRTSRDLGWDPNSAFHDALWQDFAAGYRYRVVGGDGTLFDSLRGSDPATRGTSDTFQSAAGSLDLTAGNFAGNVSLDWLDGGATARLALDSAWNTIKNAYVSGFTGQELILQNWVDVWISLESSFGQEMVVDGAKRGEISTGSGDDTIWIGVDSNGAGWTNVIKVDSGDGNDVITIARATRDYSGSAFPAAYNPAWTRTDVHAGAGNDVIASSESPDIVDGGAGSDTLVLHGPRSAYQITVVNQTATVVDTRAGSANRDGSDHLIGVERLRFDDGTLAVLSDGHGTGEFEGELSSFSDVIASEQPHLFTSSLDFGEDPYDPSDFGELSAGAQGAHFAARKQRRGGSVRVRRACADPRCRLWSRRNPKSPMTTPGVQRSTTRSQSLERSSACL